ncbi:MAG TPA: hypothetical protein VH092_11435, partial [Urbifossiella sp.]|nr:hypothetical protein [Urbifossiella sp.]
RDRVTRAVIDSLAEVERQATHPTGWRKAVRGALGAAANTLPEVALVATAAVLLWDFFVNGNTDISAFRLALIGLVPLVVIIVLHLLILLLLPVRWPAIRGEFRRVLGARLEDELGRVYRPIPGEVAAALAAERAEVDALTGDTKQVAAWLAERQQAARVGELYGS